MKPRDRSEIAPVVILKPVATIGSPSNAYKSDAQKAIDRQQLKKANELIGYENGYETDFHRSMTRGAGKKISEAIMFGIDGATLIDAPLALLGKSLFTESSALLLKSSNNISPKIWTLAEENQHIRVINAVIDGTKPGSSGIFLGEKRLSETTMRTLSDKYGIEFAQIYSIGKGKNGGGGYYSLYSGNANSVDIGIEKGMYLINHTHPAGNILPSKYDIRFLEALQAIGSPQKSSVILPFGKPASRFNIHTPTIK